MVAYQIARYECEHITIEEHNAFVDTIMGLYLSSLGQLPAIMGGQDLAARRKWDNFVYETRKKLADKALSWQKRQSAMTDAELAE